MTRRCPQGSAFGPLIGTSSRMIGLIVFSDANMSMYEDNHHFYAVGRTLADVHDDLAVCPESASSWYTANFLKGNLDKYQTIALRVGIFLPIRLRRD